MIITNKYNLPQALVEAAKSDYEVKEDEYRATSLLNGIRETILMRRHGHKIEVDVVDMIWAIFGTAVHDLLEGQEQGPSEIAEKRLKLEIGPCTLSGKFDLFCKDQLLLTDYKTTTVWKVLYKDFEDWERQAHIYSYLLTKVMGKTPKTAQITALLRDHSKPKATREKDYPQIPIYRHFIPITKEGLIQIEAFIHERLALLTEHKNTPDHELPLCSPKERWANPDTYAVMKKGRKSALRVLDTIEEAEKWIEDNPGKKGEWVERRPGQDNKCPIYCYANQYCDYFANQNQKEAV